MTAVVSVVACWHVYVVRMYGCIHIRVKVTQYQCQMVPGLSVDQIMMIRSNGQKQFRNKHRHVLPTLLSVNQFFFLFD